MQQQIFCAMGCQMLALLDATGAQAEAAVAQVPDWFAQWEQHLSRFRADSELAQLNQANGRAVHVSHILWAVIDAALAGARQSAGLVTPTLLGALEAAGYDRSWNDRSTEEVPDAVLRGAKLDTCTECEPSQAWRLIERDRLRTTVRLPTGIRLDLGGVAKGWAADQAARQLSAHGPALIDAGGDIAVSGPTTLGEPWQIDVADPCAPAHDLATLLISAGGVATSGRDYRRWQRNGQELHHIIDPRTNRPAETDVLSATVIAPTAYQAEIGAKVALILGSVAGQAWLDARPEFAGLLVLDNRQVVTTQRLQRFIAT